MKKFSKKKFRGAACGAMALIMLLGSSLAYFTDRADTSATGTAGTVDIELTSDINLLDADGKDILNPGDMRDSSFEVENMGNKSVDVRTTIVLTSSVPMTTNANGQAEYELYNRSDVVYVEGEGYKPVAGAEPVQVRSISADGTKITYAVPDYTLNGNEDFGDDKREIEDGIDTDTHDYDYVLVFAGGTENKFQNSTVTIDVLAEAKQHRNTEAGWQIVAQESYNNGSINQNAVPSADGTVTPDAPAEDENAMLMTLALDYDEYEAINNGDRVTFSLRKASNDAPVVTTDADSTDSSYSATANLVENEDYDIEIYNETTDRLVAADTITAVPDTIQLTAETVTPMVLVYFGAWNVPDDVEVITRMYDKNDNLVTLETTTEQIVGGIHTFPDNDVEMIQYTYVPLYDEYPTFTEFTYEHIIIKDGVEYIGLARNKNYPLLNQPVVAVGHGVDYYINLDLSGLPKDEEETPAATESGLFAADGSQTYTWDELIARNDITVSGGTITDADTGLTGKLVVDDSITAIGDSAFMDCSSITEVVLPDTVTSISGNAFAFCSGLTKINIPEGVTTIEGYTFMGCSNLIEVTIPLSVKTVNSMSFSSCNNLTTVNYAGTEEQWNAITFNGNTTPLTNATKNYNYVAQ